MSRRISLEDFDDAVSPLETQNAPPEPTIDVDELRSASFEDGYKSGWDDCHAEQQKSDEAVSSDLAQSLKSMELTYREARGDVLTAIQPVLDTIISQLLPKLAADGLGAMVAHELLPILQEKSDLSPELVCAGPMVPVLQSIVDRRDDISVEIRPEPNFSGAQVALRLGSESRNVDLSSAIEQIGAELESFTERLIADLPAKSKGILP